jgi:signal transduction histidine kinase
MRNLTAGKIDPLAESCPPGGPFRGLGDLTRRVLGWMLLVSLLPLVIMAYQGYHCAAQALIEETQQHLDSVLAARARLVQEWMECRSLEMQLLAANLAGTGREAPTAQQAQGWLDSVRNGRHRYNWVARYDGEGRLEEVSARPGVSPPASWRPEETEATLSLSAPSTGNGERELWFSAPLIESGDTGGWVAGGMRIRDGLDALLEDQTGLGTTGRLYAVAEDLEVLSDPLAGGRAPLRADPDIVHLAENHSHLDHGFFHLYLEVPEVLRAARTVPGTTWYLVAEADPRDALSWLGVLRWRAAFTGAATLAVLVVVSFWIARSLGRPLRELARVAQRVRGGRTEERLGPVKGAEAEEVRQAFNRMLDELREKQRELVKAATLASVGELSSSVVHEMRNPLSSIKMNLQALRRHVEPDSLYKELADIAAQQVQRVESMLDELLKYGRPVEMRPEPTSFAELAESTLAVVGDAAKAKQVTIDVNDGLNGHCVDVDPEQMCRALTNLVLNAVQAAPTGGHVLLTGRPGPNPYDVALEVRDWGPGLPNETEDRLFKPFFTTRANGTGLGLANVKKIVELHDGSVTARNRPEGGASFTIVLPAWIPSEHAHPHR